MIEHDETIGTILDALDEMGIAENTIVVYTSDNGPHMNTWPDGAMTPFRSEKNTNWEGAFRVPMLVRWPGQIDAGTVLRNVSGMVGDNGGVKSERDKFLYTDDDGLLVGMRWGDYKYVFSEQRKEGTMGVWAEPFTTLRLQKIFNLMQDPYERADITSNTYWDWNLNHVGSAYGMMDEVFQFAATFDEFPPRSFPPSFNPANVLEAKTRAIRAERALREAFPMLPAPAN